MGGLIIAYIGFDGSGVWAAHQITQHVQGQVEPMSDDMSADNPFILSYFRIARKQACCEAASWCLKWSFFIFCCPCLLLCGGVFACWYCLMTVWEECCDGWCWRHVDWYYDCYWDYCDCDC